ncbi:DUF1249 domain-containing protein [Paraglaciecola polaris]|uniref:Cytoplasmic protein n=1 Tax=Paraglaciecola polaris LMG 21857 TaxID=1129793 RepID=K6ZUN0_9ALTE|nr:DUF1249 domain-containing protein [Paraglaciecola polaris]GAC32508.1 hypothetical protein GPLA_1594 [Paraglaciecola polaris LMG 21857]|tara:strand:- start:4715 stop:5170 length:456 start_codon:yes stop_codon:yes gene_type:complete
MTGNNEYNLKRKYVPHLPSIQRVCALNYVRLIKLLPDCDTEDLEYQFKVNNTLNYSIKILECSRYTSTVAMSQESIVGPDYMRPVVRIRLYHDAQLAEVIESQHIGALKPSYEYPNIKMYQKNEKEMVNLFLSEWLLFCSKYKDQLYATSV